jgi:hypothetical protein
MASARRTEVRMSANPRTAATPDLPVDEALEMLDGSFAAISA